MSSNVSSQVSHLPCLHNSVKTLKDSCALKRAFVGGLLLVLQ